MKNFTTIGLLALVILICISSFESGRIYAELQHLNKSAFEFRNHTISPYQVRDTLIHYHKYEIYHYDYQVGYVVLPTEMKTGSLFIYVR